jgi:hypothetical protein
MLSTLITLPPLREVLAERGLADAREVPLETDGWSGARLSRLQRRGGRFVLKRDSMGWDWIARATADGPLLREAWFANLGLELPGRFVAPYEGVGADGEVVGMLMPDLTGILFDWEAPIGERSADVVLDAMAELHAHAWQRTLGELVEPPWCPLPERLLLLSRPMARQYIRWGGRAAPAGDRFLEGWAAFDRLAPPHARELVDDLSTDVRPLVAVLEREPPTLLHGDLKLANIGIAADGSLPVVDWQMVMIGPVAVELGWFLVSNSASLPWTPPETLEHYERLVGYAAEAAEDPEGSSSGAGNSELELAWIVGLLLRGWRKGLDADAGIVHPCGVSAADDLAEWCDRAGAVARRLL